MRVTKLLSVFVVLLMPGRAQCAEPPRDLRSLSERWAECYAIIYGVPVDLVKAIIDEEPDWNPCATSSKGAVGLMQLMPRTAIRFGVQNRFQLNENIRAGVAYLAYLQYEFGGDLRLVTAAYYVGEGPILLRRLEYSSADVQAYVRRVAARYRVRQRGRVRPEVAARNLHEVPDEHP